MIVAKFIWQDPNGGSPKVQRLGKEGTNFRLLDAPPKTGEIVEFQLLANGKAVLRLGCCGVRMYNGDEHSNSVGSGFADRGGAKDPKHGFHPRDDFKADKYLFWVEVGKMWYIRVFSPSFLLSDTQGRGHRSVATLEFTFIGAQLDIVSLLPWGQLQAGTSKIEKLDWQVPKKVDLQTGAGVDGFHNAFTNINLKFRTVTVRLPLSSAVENVLAVRPTPDGNSTTHESPMVLSWVKSAGWITLRSTRSFEGIPASGVAFLRKGRSTFTQEWSPGVFDSPPKWSLAIQNGNEAPDQLDYLASVVGESVKGTPHLTSMPLFRKPSADNLGRKFKIEVQLVAPSPELSPNDMHFVPMLPDPEKVAVKTVMSMPGLRSTDGFTPEFEAPFAIRDRGASVSERVEGLAYYCGVYPANWSGKWTEKQKCLIGSLALWMGGKEDFPGKDKEGNVVKITYFLTPLSYAADLSKRGTGGKIRLPRCIGFQVGESGTTGFLEDSGTLDLPVVHAKPEAIELTGAQSDLLEDTQPPLLIPVEKNDNAGGAMPNKLSLRMAERRVPGSPERMSLRLDFAEVPVRKKELPSNKMLYLDRSPFLVALLDFDHLYNFDYHGGKELAYWTTEGAHRGWQLRCTSEQITLWLPPQGLGEAMEKDRPGGGRDYPGDIGEEECASIRFTPAARLELKTGELARRYGLSPTFLRDLLGGLKDHRLVGLPLKSARFELLYGLMFEIRGVPWLRVAELFSRLGLPPRPLPKIPRSLDHSDAASLIVWSGFREAWQKRLGAISRRLGVYEVFDDRQEDFDENGEPLGLELRGDATNRNLRAWLRKDADLQPSFERMDSAAKEAVPLPYAKDGLAGSYAWAFESRLLYEALGNNYVEAKQVDAFEAVISRLYFSALGGWGTQQASFDNGRAIIAVTVEMGRVSELRVERIGRIKCTCNRAKLVTVFRRTVLGSTQFHDQQDAQLGRPMLRKFEEYVEFLEKHRPLPDPQTRAVNARMTGCVTGCSCDEKIPVDSRWGRDVYHRDGTPHGWRLPLMVAGANKGIYGKANVLLHVHADPATGHAEETGRVVNLENLEFWTDVTPGLGADTDKWPMVYRLDIGAFNPARIDIREPLKDNPVDPAKGIFHQKGMGAPAVPRGAAEFTFHLEGFTRGANLIGHLYEDVAQEASPKISSVLRTVTLCRGTVPPLLEGKLGNFAGAWDDVRSDVESFVHACEEIVSGDPLGGEDLDKLAAVTLKQWDELLASKTAAGQTVKDVIGEMKGALEADSTAIETWVKSLRRDLEWRLEQGKEMLCQQLDLLGEKLPEPAKTSQWIDESLGKVQGSISSWKTELSLLIGKENESGVEKVLGIAKAIGSRKVNVAQAQEMLVALHAAVEKKLTQVIRNSATGAEPALATLFAKLRQSAQEAKNGLDITGDTVRKDAEILKAAAETLQAKLPDKADKLKAWLFDIVTTCQEMAESGANSAAKRAQYLQGRIGEIEGVLRAETDTLLEAIKDSKLAVLEKIDGLEDEIAGIGKKIGDLLNAAKTDFTEIRERFQNISDRVTSRISNLGGLLPPEGAVVSGALEVYRAFGKVPAVPMLEFEEMAGLGKAEAFLTRRFQSVAYGFSPVIQAGEAARKNMMKLYENLADPKLAREAAATIRNFVNDAGKLVRIEPSVKSLVDHAKNTAGEIVNEARLKAAALQTHVNEITDRLVTDAEKAAEAQLKDLLPDFGGLKLEKLLGAVGVSDKFAARLKQKTITTHGFDVQTMSGFIDCKVDDLELDGEPTLFAFGPMAMRLSRPVLRSHLRINSERGSVVGRTEEGVITADWNMCFGGTPMVTFREAKLRCVNGNLSMDLDPSKLKMNGLLNAISDMISASEAANGGGAADEEEEKPFSVGVINELPAGITAFCRLRLTLPDLAAGTFAMTNISLGAYFEVSIRLPALEPFVPQNEIAPGLPAPNPGDKKEADKRTIDDINNNELVDPDLRLNPIEGGGSMRPKPVERESDAGILNGAFFRIAAGLNISSREAPFNITVFILGGCGWFILDVEYMVPLGKGKPRMSCYLSAGIGVSAGLALNLGFLKGAIFVSLALEGECLVRTGLPNMYRFGVVLTFAGHVSVCCIASASLVIVLAVRYETGGQLSGEGYVRLKIKICWCFTLKVNRGFTYKFGKVEKTSSTETSGPDGKSLSQMRGESGERYLASDYGSPDDPLNLWALDQDTLREATHAAAMFA